MQIPLWLYLLTLLLALLGPEMASLLYKRGTASGVAAGIRAFFPSTPLLRSSSILLSSTTTTTTPTTIPTSSSFTSSTPKTNYFSTTAANMSGSTEFIKAIEGRRTIYALKKESVIPDAKVQEIITKALLNVPSSFNSQSSRIILLVKGEHDKLWDFAKEALKGVVPAEAYPQTEQRLNMFQAAYGTVLFFVSRKAVQALQDKLPLYADRFPTWATQSDGMHQYAVWTALEAEGLGANLQHYNPLIDAKVQAEWKVDPDWELSSQLVFGTPAGGAGEKTAEPIEERFKTYGA